MVRAMAVRFKVDPELMVRLVKCESGFKPNIKNSTSTASGLFQFLDGTYYSQAKIYGITALKSNPEAQAELAARMIAAGGLIHWEASRACWQR